MSESPNARHGQSSRSEDQRDGTRSRSMRIIETQIDVAASASSVWQILTDFPAYSDWNE
jgi:hypothetical protein